MGPVIGDGGAPEVTAETFRSAAEAMDPKQIVVDSKVSEVIPQTYRNAAYTYI